MRSKTRYKLARLFVGVGLLVIAALGLTAGAAGASNGWQAATGAWGRFPYNGAVFAETNDPGSNQLITFIRRADGSLIGPWYTATGGTGTGQSLGDQGAVIVSDDHNWVFAVDAGSNQISEFHLTSSGPVLTAVVASGGTMPVSLTLHDRLLYVLNAGGDGNITGFRVNPVGHLIAVPHSTEPLSAAGSGAAQISFTADGGWLVVTEKATNVIDTYAVGNNGRAGSPNSQVVDGLTPYGFAIDAENHVVVSIAHSNAMSSFTIDGSGMLNVVSDLTPTGSPAQAAPCWVIFAGPGSQYVYTANAGSASITGYSVSSGGDLTVLNADGVTGSTGMAPTDMAASGNGMYVYTRNGDGTISAFMVMANGQLSAVNSGVSGLPMTTVGLAGF